ncbi:phytoene/squalene synthase family protein [Paenibacillus athensensis]|uniref:Uncharacterized protein n=1 Tax=Paenibacillus athensensis TaxID=1967502 RepID=A0A4Y8Q353_9BACL|nr:phytoene/squalene synthase family protein [Paenibacillus athensensis]MCD1261028.1 phytoene/squalene synthase family protein [Paenibacillus athensensis]
MNHPAFFSDCEHMIRSHSSSFYKAFSFLESPKREAVHVMYAFCRMIDDSVDEPERSPYTLEELEDRFRSLESAEGHFIWPALRWLFSEFALSPEPYFLQMAGQRLDTSLTRYDTVEQLEHYCYLVAGTVGSMLVPILHGGRVGERLAESAVYLGKAMQIVNIIRDIGEDCQRGRRYIPLELMQQYGCTERDFENGTVHPGFIRMLEHLMELAGSWLQLGLRELEQYPATSAFCVELAAQTYMAILDEVRASRYQVFRQRAVVSDKAKLSILYGLLQRYPQLTQEAQARLAAL